MPAAKPVDTLETVRAKIGRLSEAEQARCLAYSRSVAAALKYIKPDEEIQSHPIFPADAPEPCKVVEYDYVLKRDAPPGMEKYRKIIKLDDYYFDSVTGMMVTPEVLSVFYAERGQHRRQWLVTQFDLIVLFAISSRGAENIYQIQSELASRRREDGTVWFIEREHIIEACQRLKAAQLWRVGELPRPKEERVLRKDK